MSSEPAHTTTEDHRQRWVLPERLTRHDVETWLGALPDSVDEVTFHLSYKGCTSSPGAAESLQAAICHLQRIGVKTKYSAPDGSFGEGRATGLFEHGEGKGTEAERTLAYRLPGLMLAQLCEPAPGLDELRPVAVWQEQYLREHQNIFGHGKYRALAVIGARDHRTHLRSADNDRQNTLEQRIVRMLSTEQFVPRSDNPRFQELVEFVYQATENTFDHARRDFNGELITQVRTVSMERHQVGTFAAHVPLAELAPDEGSALHRYLLALRARASKLQQDPERLSLLTFTVADGGVGIAAKMNGGMDVYDGDLDAEHDLVQRAMRPTGTTKPPSDLGRGLGLFKMMRATRRLNGLLEIRTGRLALSRTYIDPGGDITADDFRAPGTSALDLERSSEAHVLVAGTAVSVTFPAFNLRPRRSGLRDRSANPGMSSRPRPAVDARAASERKAVEV